MDCFYFVLYTKHTFLRVTCGRKCRVPSILPDLQIYKKPPPLLPVVLRVRVAILLLILDRSSLSWWPNEIGRKCQIGSRCKNYELPIAIVKNVSSHVMVVKSYLCYEEKNHISAGSQ